MRKILLLAGLVLCQGELQPYVTWPSGRLIDNGRGGMIWVKPQSEILWLQPLEGDNDESFVPPPHRNPTFPNRDWGLYDNPVPEE